MACACNLNLGEMGLSCEPWTRWPACLIESVSSEQIKEPVSQIRWAVPEKGYPKVNIGFASTHTPEHIYALVYT